MGVCWWVIEVSTSRVAHCGPEGTVEERCDNVQVDETGPAVRRLLVNRYEAAADQLLRKLAEPEDRLLLKVGLKDALDLDRIPDLTSRERSYGLMAHLDFVMVDAESTPRFAVELDGRQHMRDRTTQQRDAMKDALCERARLPLLRIGSDFARVEGRWRVLDYLIAAYYRSEAFYKMQLDGSIPPDEPFYMGSFLVRDERGRLSFDGLDMPAISHLRELHEEGRLLTPNFDGFCFTLPEQRAVQATQIIAVDHDRYLIGKTVVRDFHFQGVSPADLASELSIAELGHLADRWLAGHAVAVNSRSLRKEAAIIQRAIDSGNMLSMHGSSGGGMAAGGTAPTISFSSDSQ